MGGGMDQGPPPLQQHNSAPPTGPPRGMGGGPKPMSSMMGGPPPGGQMGGPPQQVQVNPADLVNAYQALFAQFIKHETQKKVQADTENKLAIMVEKVNGN